MCFTNDKFFKAKDFSVKFSLLNVRITDHFEMLRKMLDCRARLLLDESTVGLAVHNIITVRKTNDSHYQQACNFMVVSFFSFNKT